MEPVADSIMASHCRQNEDTFDAAKRIALKWASKAQASAAAQAGSDCDMVVPSSLAVTMADVIEHYKSYPGANTGKPRAEKYRKQDNLTLLKHFSTNDPEFAATPFQRITREDFLRALDRIAAPINLRDLDDDEAREEALKRNATRNKVKHLIVAACNVALAAGDNFHGGQVPSELTWAKLPQLQERARNFKFEARQFQYLMEAAKQVDGDFANLLFVGMNTGARRGELFNARVRDLNPKEGTLDVDGKTGPRTITLTGDFTRWLFRLTKGRPPNDRLLQFRGRAWGKNDIGNNELFRKTCEIANQMINEAYLNGEEVYSFEHEDDVCFYALRHTYISDCLNNGMPIHSVAINVGTSIRMIEKNYGKVSASEFRKQVQAARGSITDAPEPFFRPVVEAKPPYDDAIWLALVSEVGLYTQRIPAIFDKLGPLWKHYGKLDRDTLQQLIWSAPIKLLGQMFGVSDNAVRKQANKAGIPLPPFPGYWQVVEAGKLPYPNGKPIKKPKDTKPKP